MKKFLTAMVAGATLFGAGAAFAANQVQMTLTSPTILKSGCEKAGSVTFAFDADSNIKTGDWWYFDLPVNVSICKDIDYFIAAGALANTITLNATGENIAFAGADNLPATINAASIGPVTATKVDASQASAVAYTVEAQTPMAGLANEKMAIRVKGTLGGRRVLLTAYGDGGKTTPKSQIKVQPGWKLTFKILDGQPYATANATATAIFPNLDGVEADGTMIFHEPATASTAVEVLTGNVPVLGNTLCINASQYGSELVGVSYSSKNDKFTFTGDNQIAHVGAAASISLKNCKSSDLDQILIGAQSACNFTYKLQTYSCGSRALNNDNLIIQTASSFGDIGDRYDLKLESLTNGVYFGSSPTLNTYDLVVNKDMCVAGATLVTPPAFKLYKGDVTTGITFGTGATCTVASSNQVNMIKTVGGGIDLDNKNGLRVDLNAMIFDSAVVAVGSEAKVKATLSKYPCGDLFEGTVTLGTFVTTCTGASTSSSTLMFPFFPPMDPAAAPGWWGGYIIVNGSTAAGTVALTYTDAAGATKTYTTPSVAAGAQFNGSTVTYSMLGAGTGTFDKTKNYSIKAACGFGSAAGFAFVSSPEAAASYTAYTNSGSAWQ